MCQNGCQHDARHKMGVSCHVDFNDYGKPMKITWCWLKVIG